MPTQLPLFPLKTVLFPGALLPLHIFEPRYRQMLADVAAGDRRFGLIPPGTTEELPPPGAIGCEALLRAVWPLADGRSNVVVGGERRFAFQGPAISAAPYHSGLVDWIEDEPDVQVPTEDEVAALRALAQRYALALNKLNDQAIDHEFSAAAPELTFQAAALLEWDFESRQSLLETRSATVRVTRLLHALPGLVAEAERRAAVHEAARGNGAGAYA
jgi:Lon protease-like protein